MKLVKKILTISFWRSQQGYQSNAGQGQSLQVGSSGISPQNDVLSWELDQNLSFSPSYSLLRPNGSKLRYKRWRNKEKNLKYFLKLIWKYFPTKRLPIVVLHITIIDILTMPSQDLEIICLAKTNRNSSSQLLLFCYFILNSLNFNPKINC